MPYEPPPSITVAIPGLLRGRVADGLRREAREMREQYQKRRAKTQMGQFAHKQADELFALALKIDF